MSLIAWWPLNGDTLDYSGNGNHGVNNGATIDNNGKIGKCYDFGTDQDGFNIDVPNNNFAGLYDFSMFAWIYIKGNHLHYDGTIISSGDWNKSHWSFGISQDNTAVKIRYPNHSISYSFALNTWYHVGYIRDGMELRIYINGNLIASVVDTTCIPLASGYSNTKIGMDTYTSNYFNFNGKINDVRIYGHALSEKEIKEISKAKILHYTFDDFQEPTKNIVLNTNLDTGWTKSYCTSIQWNDILPPDGINSSVVSFYDSNTDKYGYWFCYGDYAPQIPDTIYTVSLYVRTKDNNFRIRCYTADNSETGRCFSDYVSVPNDGEWHRVIWESFLNPADSQSNSLSFMFCYGSEQGEDQRTWLCAPQMEAKDHATPFTPTSRSGIVRDISGYGNGAVLELATTPKWTEGSKIGGGCYEFNGKDTYVKPNNIDIMNVMTVESFSISFWIKREDTSGEIHDIIGGGNYGHSTGGVAFSLHSNGSFYYDIYTEMAGRHCITLSSSTIASNIWNHVILFVNRENNTFGIYVNGINVSERNLANELISWNINNYPLKIGKGYYAGTLGLIDDIRIYATALSDKDIKELYQTRASLDNKGNFNIGKLEERPNIAYKVDNAIKDKVYQDGLNSYTQSNCKVTLTDKGFRIYRPPNLSPTVDGNTMWGGLKVQLFKIDSNILKKGHKYRISFIVTGQSSNGAERIYFSNNMGWSGTSRGLTCVSASKYNSLESNFKGSKEIYAVFDITDDIWKVCTSSYSSFVEGEYYNCYRDLCWGFGYKDTGELGTDLYVTNFKVVDITEDESTLIKDSGVVKSSHISELGPTDGLITYYPLNGNPKDLSGNKLDGIVNGATVSNGLEGLCYEFDGESSNIKITTIPITNNHTISIWFYKSDWAVDPWENLLSHSTNSYQILVKPSSTNRPALRFFPLDNTVSYELNRWNHVVISRQENQESLYLNGELKFSVVNNNRTIPASGPWCIGSYGNGSSENFKGKIQDVRIYNRALTQEEIMILYKMKGSNSKMQLVNNGTLYVNKIIEGY